MSLAIPVLPVSQPGSPKQILPSLGRVLFKPAGVLLISCIPRRFPILSLTLSLNSVEVFEGWLISIHSSPSCLFTLTSPPSISLEQIFQYPGQHEAFVNWHRAAANPPRLHSSHPYNLTPWPVLLSARLTGEKVSCTLWPAVSCALPNKGQI